MEEEPSEEEKARIAADKQALEEAYVNRKYYWDAYSDEQKFYTFCEDPYREPRIQFPEPAEG